VSYIEVYVMGVFVKLIKVNVNNAMKVKGRHNIKRTKNNKYREMTTNWSNTGTTVSAFFSSGVYL